MPTKFLDSTGLAHFWGKVKDNDVKQSYSEIETQTETKTEHVQPDGTMATSGDNFGTQYNGTFRVIFSGTLEEESYVNELSNSPRYNEGLWFGYFQDEEGNVLGSSNDYDSNNDLWTNLVNAQANARYCYEFQLNPNASITEVSVMLHGCSFYGESGNREPIGNCILVAGSDWDSDLEYTPGENSNIPNQPSISISLPEVGESVELEFNAWMNVSNNYSLRFGVIPEAYKNKTLTIENIDGMNFRLCFLWDTSSDVETTTRQKLLKTTVERKDETEVVVSKPLSGLLQDLSVTVDSSIGIEEVSSDQSYYSLVYLSDTNPVIFS